MKLPPYWSMHILDLVCIGQHMSESVRIGHWSVSTRVYGSPWLVWLPHVETRRVPVWGASVGLCIWSFIGNCSNFTNPHSINIWFILFLFFARHSYSPQNTAQVWTTHFLAQDLFFFLFNFLNYSYSLQHIIRSPNQIILCSGIAKLPPFWSM